MQTALQIIYPEKFPEKFFVFFFYFQGAMVRYVTLAENKLATWVSELNAIIQVKYKQKLNYGSENFTESDSFVVKCILKKK